MKILSCRHYMKMPKGTTIGNDLTVNLPPQSYKYGLRNPMELDPLTFFTIACVSIDDER